MGDRFLRHLSRVRLILYIFDLTQLLSQPPLVAVAAVQEMLRAADPSYLDKAQWLILNKIDLLPPDYPLADLLAALKTQGWRCYAVSAATGAGLGSLSQDLAALNEE